MKKVAVLQSNYLPWKGYFDIINSVDLFIFYDDVQYTKNDWRNRNRIKTPGGIKWITVPVGTNLKRRIIDVELKDNKWQNSHWGKIRWAYSKAPYFKEFRSFFEESYTKYQWKYLYEVNRYFIINISKKFLGIKTEFADSRDYNPSGAGQERLMSVLKKSGAKYYLSGPSAKKYINEDKFKKSGIMLEWKDYSDYPEYEQPFGKFEHRVSIIDVLFNTGPKSSYYIWGHREEKAKTGGT